MLLVFRTIAPLKVAVPPYVDVYVTVNELAVVTPEALLKVKAALPAGDPALL